MEAIPEDERFSPKQLVSDACDGGVDARNCSSVQAIVDALAEEARPGDVVLLLSNGGFGGIYDTLPAALA